MNQITKTHMKIIFTFVAVLAIISGMIYLNHTKASIDSLTLAPSTLGTDDVAGKTDAAYTVAYTSGSFDPTSSLSQITVTFPSGYVITDGALDPSTAINGSSACTAAAGYVCFNNDDS